MEERYKSMIVVDLMLTRKNNERDEVLLALRKNTGYNDGNFELPGGHVETGEDLIQAMIREAKEELNIELKREDLKIKHILHRFKANRINFIISTDKYEGTLEVGEPDKCEKIEWFDINNLPENIEIKTKNVLKEIQDKTFYDNGDYINLNKE